MLLNVTFDLSFIIKKMLLEKKISFYFRVTEKLTLIEVVGSGRNPKQTKQNKQKETPI